MAATRPGTPGPFYPTQRPTNTVVYGDADPGSNGGSPILQWQLGYGTNPGEPTSFMNLSSTGAGTVTGLTPGATYYFWNRQRNAIGWSDYSARTSVEMDNVPDPPRAPHVTRRWQDKLWVEINPGYNGGSTITSYKLGYGYRGEPPQAHIVSGGGGFFSIENLNPGQEYLLWGKVSNRYGESAWGPIARINLLAGARVKLGFSWRRAVPYVKVGGVWKMARVWGRSKGKWIQTED